MMVAIPELDGAIGPMVFGGRSAAVPARRCARRDMRRRMRERADDAGGARRQAGRAAPHARGAERKVAIVLFNFPPNAGNTGTAAYLSVFESLHRTLPALNASRLHGRRAGRRRRAARPDPATATPPRFGADANVAARIPADDHVRRERWLRRDRGAMGPGAGPAAERRRRRSSCSASGSATSSSASSPPSATRATRCGCCSRTASRRPTPSRPSIAGCARISAPTRVLHFGTHGALEFMPGKQAGPVRRLLARPADRRPAELLSLCLEQSRPKARSQSGARRRR